MEEIIHQIAEEVKRWPFRYYMGLGVMLTILIHTIVAYYRLRRKNDREFGKGWRKRSNY
jgi:hypothetical protein